MDFYLSVLLLPERWDFRGWTFIYSSIGGVGFFLIIFFLYFTLLYCRAVAEGGGVRPFCVPGVRTSLLLSHGL